jgi:hypothetical protein
MIDNLCPHDRSEGAVCIPCMENGWPAAHKDGDKSAYSPRAFAGPFYEGGKKVYEGVLNKTTTDANMGTGLDAPYYDFPKNIHCAQDMIEWLGLDFANGNILKSLIREYGPTTKKTSPLYEAEKRFYFSQRHLRSVQQKGAGRDGLSGDVEKGLEDETKE